MSKYQDWIPVFSTGTDYEADMVRDRLDNAGLDAVVLTKRDHAFNLNVGDLANVMVLVPPSDADEARAVLQEKLSDEELEKAALSADPNAPDAHTPEQQSRVDSGHDRIDFSTPDDES